MSFKIPSFYGRVSLYRKKPAKSASSVKPELDSPSPQTESADAPVREGCSAGPKLYTLLHRVHNASCSGASHSTDTTCCDSDIGDPRATQEADVEDSEWRQPQVDTEEYFAHDDRYDIQVAYTQQTWPDFEYDPRLVSVASYF